MRSDSIVVGAVGGTGTEVGVVCDGGVGDGTAGGISGLGCGSWHGSRSRGRAGGGRGGGRVEAESIEISGMEAGKESRLIAVCSR